MEVWVSHCVGAEIIPFNAKASASVGPRLGRRSSGHGACSGGARGAANTERTDMKHLALGGVLLALAITSAGADDMDDLRREAAKSGVTDFEHPMREITSARTAFVVAAERTCAQTGTAMKVTANLGEYCTCYAGRLADVITAAEFVQFVKASVVPASLGEKMKTVSAACANETHYGK